MNRVGRLIHIGKIDTMEVLSEDSWYANVQYVLLHSKNRGPRR